MTEFYETQEDYHESLYQQHKDGVLKNRVKPVVHYKRLNDREIVVGKAAQVITIDHPCEDLNFGPFVNTSVVVAITEDGFESTYTRYVEVKD